MAFSSSTPRAAGFSGNSHHGSPAWPSRSGLLEPLDFTFPAIKMQRVSEMFWFVAHTRPRCEKKFVRYCAREQLEATLPCYKAPHRYRGKTVVFEKPLFPGYVFLKITEEQKRLTHQSDCLANLLTVVDQELFGRQLADILQALESNVEVRLAPAIGEGMRVKIKSGPLRGLDGWVEHRHGPNVVLLRLDFIGQAAAVKVDALDLELI